ncbi:uncharacterized protein LOC125492502 [Beta vulgaris subsp. vulgaris]|uniref:uncharacterized protein LOC125492502 n=1 Tax=Beta vulgaris subsp. vulgaris TaxID=3555 RepID=UPI002547C475|nr:uncharacterized protein LOC125492502 [Beta vulgaris subsp. vulgaris]
MSQFKANCSGGNFGGELGLSNGHGCNGSQIGVSNNKESNASQLGNLIGLGVQQFQLQLEADTNISSDHNPIQRELEPHNEQEPYHVLWTETSKMHQVSSSTVPEPHTTDIDENSFPGGESDCCSAIECDNELKVVANGKVYLSEVCYKEGISGVYGFCDTNVLSPLTPTTTEEGDPRSDYLACIFASNDGKNINQLFFAPYNENKHWMLAVISPWNGLVYWLDPAGVENEVRPFAKKIINEGIIKFSTYHRKDIKKIKKNPEIRWNQIECPRQPLGTLYCGYYVCRYMLGTVQLRRLVIPDKYYQGIGPNYSQEKIDELRELWITYVGDQHEAQMMNEL